MSSLTVTLLPSKNPPRASGFCAGVRKKRARPLRRRKPAEILVSRCACYLLKGLISEHGKDAYKKQTIQNGLYRTMLKPTREPV
jgi:hypothetical protein